METETLHVGTVGLLVFIACWAFAAALYYTAKIEFSGDEVPRCVCAWCGEVLDPKPCNPDKQSHGICKACLADIVVEVDRMRAERLKEESAK